MLEVLLGKASREHCFKEYRGWKGETYRLWEEVGNIPGRRRLGV